LTWRRFAIALAIVLLLHLLFIFVIAPYLEFEHAQPSRTEVVQISPQELAKMKDRILHPLLKQEQRKQYKVDEPPPDAQMMSDFNQKVPKEQTARAQRDQPLDGGGGKPRPAEEQKQKAQSPKLSLSQLGLGAKVPKPTAPDPPAPAEASGPQGPKGPYRPLGRDKGTADENLLNAAESKFYSFFSRLEEPIIRNWFYLIRSHEGQIHSELQNHKYGPGTELPVTVEFVIDQKGEFRSITVVESSTLPTFDWVTKEAVRKLGSVPNPPPDLFEGGQYYTRRLRFILQLTDAPLMSARPNLYW
jgi:TonB family protein